MDLTLLNDGMAFYHSTSIHVIVAVTVIVRWPDKHLLSWCNRVTSLYRSVTICLQNSVLSDTQSAPSPQLSAVVSFDAGSGQVHCHVVAVYYEGESRHTLPSAAAIAALRNATPATAVPATTLSHTAVSRRKPDSPRAAEGEPHHLRLCPSVTGFTSSRGEWLRVSEFRISY